MALTTEMQNRVLGAVIGKRRDVDQFIDAQKVDPEDEADVRDLWTKLEKRVKDNPDTTFAPAPDGF